MDGWMDGLYFATCMCAWQASLCFEPVLDRISKVLGIGFSLQDWLQQPHVHHSLRRRTSQKAVAAKRPFGGDEVDETLGLGKVSKSEEDCNTYKRERQYHEN